MRPLFLIALPLLAILAAGCRPQKTEAPSWVQAAPARCEMAVSGQASWLLEQPQFQALLAKYPLAEQSLDIFLKKAHIAPHGETGRVSLFAMDSVAEMVARKGTPQTSGFLLQFHGFRQPRALQVAVAESFPIEGSLQVQGSDLPLHVVLDFNQAHIRILTDLSGNLWMGDLSALTSLGSSGPMPRRHPIQLAAAWIDGTAPLQGFLRPESLLKDLSGRLPSDITRELPQGIECLAWSVKPGAGEQPLYSVHISITGTPESIQKATPWLQRIVAIATSLRTGSAPPPELVQERSRALLRCQLSWEQVSQVLAKMAQPNLLPSPGNKTPRP
jgi:hypothetical protein